MIFLKYLSLLCLAFFSWTQINSQNVGIGTNSPQQKLDVKGAIKIGEAAIAPVAGTIQWNESKKLFEGFNGVTWVPFGNQTSGWGNKEVYSTENESLADKLNDSENYRGSLLGISLASWKQFVLAGAPRDHTSSLANAPQPGSARMYINFRGQWMRRHVSFYHRPLNGAEYGEAVAVDSVRAYIGVSSQRRVFIYNHYDGYFLSGRDSITDPALSHTPELSSFGKSLSLSKEFLAIGAPEHKHNNVSGAGRAYLYRYDGTRWLAAAGLTLNDASLYDHFGSVVLLAGDYFIVSAKGKRVNNLSDAGRVYIYRKITNSIWNPVDTIESPVPQSGEYFGTSMAIHGNTLIVGTGNADIGAAYIYKFENGIVTYETTVTDNQSGSGFGYAVAAANNRVAVGVVNATVRGNHQQGKVIVYKRERNSWIKETELAQSDGKAQDNFGTSIVFTEEGIAVGAPKATVGESSVNGKVYFFKNQE